MEHVTKNNICAKVGNNQRAISQVRVFAPFSVPGGETNSASIWPRYVVECNISDAAY